MPYGEHGAVESYGGHGVVGFVGEGEERERERERESVCVCVSERRPSTNSVCGSRGRGALILGARIATALLRKRALRACSPRY